MPHTTIHVNRREEKADGEGQDESQRGFNKPGLLGGKQEDHARSLFSLKRRWRLARGVCCPHTELVHLDFRRSISKINYFIPFSFIFYLTFLPQMLAGHQSGPRQDTGDQMSCKIWASALQEVAISDSEAATGEAVFMAQV